MIVDRICCVFGGSNLALTIPCFLSQLRGCGNEMVVMAAFGVAFPRYCFCFSLLEICFGVSIAYQGCQWACI